MTCVRLWMGICVVAAVLVSTTVAWPRVHPSVHRTLRRQGTANIFVALREPTETVFESDENLEFATREEKIIILVDRLTAHAKRTQAPLNVILAYESSESNSSRNSTPAPLYSRRRSFWINNQVYFKDATFELVNKLSALPSLLEVREEEIFELPAFFETGATNATKETNGSTDIEWGVAKIQAPAVWKDWSFTGQGVVVGVIDTGVRHTHSALRNSFRSDYGWFDPENNSATPFDDFGHGTHVTGTIVGADGIGVAPGAKWIACRGCPLGHCPESLLISCAQFMVCPTNTNGTNRNCSKAPDLINNSWSGPALNTGYAALVAMWRAAGIIPIAANGNGGPECVSSRAPGCYDIVISVGATNSSDGLANYSSRGPTRDGRVKPDISAPGSKIRSCWNASDGDFRTISGTSMATPHVAGVVALVLSANASLTFDEVKQVLFTSTVKAALMPTEMSCGAIASTSFPNNEFGYGRVNALDAVHRVLEVKPAPTPPPSSSSLRLP